MAKYLVFHQVFDDHYTFLNKEKADELEPACVWVEAGCSEEAVEKAIPAHRAESRTLVAFAIHEDNFDAFAKFTLRSKRRTEYDLTLEEYNGED